MPYIDFPSAVEPNTNILKRKKSSSRLKESAGKHFLRISHSDSKYAVGNDPEEKAAEKVLHKEIDAAIAKFSRKIFEIRTRKGRKGRKVKD